MNYSLLNLCIEVERNNRNFILFCRSLLIVHNFASMENFDNVRLKVYVVEFIAQHSADFIACLGD